MDPQQELFSAVLMALKEKYEDTGVGVYDTDLPPEDTPLDSYIDSEEVDIDELMEKTKDFLSKANATKKAVKEILKEYEEQMAKKKAQEL